jgi:hypothetical protein
MLGKVLGALTNEVTAAESLSMLGDTAMLEQVRQAAAVRGVTQGVFVAATVRHLIDHGTRRSGSIWSARWQTRRSRGRPRCGPFWRGRFRRHDPLSPPKLT